MQMTTKHPPCKTTPQHTSRAADMSQQPNPIMQQRIIVMSLVGGVLMFLIVAIVLNQSQGAFINNPALHTGLVAGQFALAAAAIPIAFVVRKKAAQETDQRATSLIILGAAILEGPAILACVTVLLTAQRLPSIAVAVVLMAIMVGTFALSRPRDDDDNPFANLGQDPNQDER